MDKCRQVLELAGVAKFDATGRVTWTGGDTVVVQLGDVLDRGDVEIGIVSLLRELDRCGTPTTRPFGALWVGQHALFLPSGPLACAQPHPLHSFPHFDSRLARAEGGQVWMLNGNHESLNVCGDFRYVSPGAFLESAIAAGLRDERVHEFDAQVKARFSVYSPGGAMARELSKNPTVLIVNDTVFVHGGLMPEHVRYGLDKMNKEARGSGNPAKSRPGARVARRFPLLFPRRAPGRFPVAPNLRRSACGCAGTWTRRAGGSSRP